MEGVIARIESHAAILYGKGQMVRCQEEWKKCEWAVKMEGGHLLLSSVGIVPGTLIF